jgi:hypothetical protein
VASSEDVGAAIKEMERYVDDENPDHKILPEEMAKRLIHTAMRMESQDNVSVMVVKMP